MCRSPIDDSVETVIFVDVDGVLNVGVKDQGGAPLLYNKPNQVYAANHLKRQRPQDAECALKLLAVGEQQVKGEEGFYSDLACPAGTHLCEVLVRHLALVIAASGDRCQVVLSSNWRKPHHAARVQMLEAEVSRHLGREWAFDARTRPAEERCAADRLRCIGDFVESLCVNGRCRDGRLLRLLVLEDFFITPLDGWVCSGQQIDSSASVEAYLLKRARRPNVTAHLVHTYDEWTTSSGMLVQVGTGLTEKPTKQALNFLSLAAPTVGKSEPILESIDLAKFASVAKITQPIDKACSLPSSPSGKEPRLSEYIAAVLPWLTMYLPCSA